jgi:hypothetical protein
MPAYLLREWTNDGKLASGGTLSFYISGTTTPKTVYADAALTIPLPNPVVLSASGSAVIFLGAGAYRIHLKDSTGAQIAPPVDGILGDNGGAAEGSNLSYAFVKLYNDLRTLTSVPDVVYVSGRLVEGDGGQGLFQLLTTGTGGLVDDDGIILTSASGTHVYKRIFDGYVDPQWYGLSYGVASNQSVYLLKALAASIQYNFPVLVAGSVYLAQNVTVPAHASLTFTDDGFLVAATSINVTFADDSKLVCSGRTFGTYIHPLIGKRVIDTIKLSYMGDTSADARMDKLLLASPSPDQPIEIDESVSILASTWIVPNILRFTNSAVVTFTGTAGLVWVSKYLEVQAIKLFQINSTSSNTFDFGDSYAYPEMFGAIGNGVADDSAILALTLNAAKRVRLVDNKTYLCASNISFADAQIKGAGTILLPSTVTLTCSSLELDGVTVSALGRVTLANTATVTGYVSLGDWTLSTSAPLLTWYEVYDPSGEVRYGSAKQQTIVANKFSAGSNDVLAVGRVVVLPGNVTLGAPWVIADVLVTNNAAITDLYTAGSAYINSTTITNRALGSAYVTPALIDASIPDAIWAGAIGTGARGEIIPVDYAIEPLAPTTDYTYSIGGLSFYPNAPTIDDFTASIVPITRNMSNIRWTLSMSGAVIPLLSNVPATITITAVSDRFKRILGLSTTRYLYNRYVGRTLDIGNAADAIATSYTVNPPYLVSCAFTSPYVLTFKFYDKNLGNRGPSPAFTGNTPNPEMGWIDIFAEWLPPNSGTIQNMRYVFGTEGNIYNNGPAV